MSQRDRRAIALGGLVMLVAGAGSYAKGRLDEHRQVPELACRDYQQQAYQSGLEVGYNLSEEERRPPQRGPWLEAITDFDPVQGVRTTQLQAEVVDVALCQEMAVALTKAKLGRYYKCLEAR